MCLHICIGYIVKWCHFGKESVPARRFEGVWAGKFIKAGLAAQHKHIDSNVCDCALLCNRCVIYAGCDIILNPPACFLISLQEGSSADSESIPQKVIHTLPVCYKHQAAACLSSLYFVLLSVCLTAVFPFASPHETTPSCLILSPPLCVVILMFWPVTTVCDCVFTLSTVFSSVSLFMEYLRFD